MPEKIEQNKTPEEHQEGFRELFRDSKWLEAVRYAIQNSQHVTIAHEDPESIPPEERYSVNEAIREVATAQDWAKANGDSAEFERLEAEYRGILFALFDPEWAQEEYDQTKRSFDDEPNKNQ